MVTACLPMMRCRSRTCFSSSRRRLIGTTSSPALTAATLRNQPEVAEAFARFDSITKAILPVGSWNPPHSQLYDALTAEERAELRTKGACAEIGATLVDSMGKQIAPEFSERCIAISGEQLKRIDEVIVVGGGLAKAAAIRAVLLGGFANAVVTERGAARALLDSEKESVASETA